MGGIEGWELGRLEIALRRQEPAALRDFYSHFRPLLMHHARLLGVERSVREEIAMTFIGDLLIELPTRTAFPTNLSAYVLTAFRYRVGQLYRSETLQKSAMAEQEADSVMGENPVEAESCSAFSRRAAAGEVVAEADAAPAEQPALREFWRCVRKRLSVEDRILLGLLRDETPSSEIADTFGIPAGTVRVRIHRLRNRIRAAAAATLDQLSLPDRQHVGAILRRSGLLLPDLCAYVARTTASRPPLRHGEVENAADARPIEGTDNG